MKTGNFRLPGPGVVHRRHGPAVLLRAGAGCSTQAGGGQPRRLRLCMPDCAHAPLHGCAGAQGCSANSTGARREVTENDVEMPIGEEGIWGTISAVSPQCHDAGGGYSVPETQPGSARSRSTASRPTTPCDCGSGMGMITEVETVIERKPGLPAPFGDPAKLVHDPAFSQVEQPEERRERDRLRDVANGYFSTISRNDGEILTEFDPDCQRTENVSAPRAAAMVRPRSRRAARHNSSSAISTSNKRVRQRSLRTHRCGARRMVVATWLFRSR